MPDALRWGQSVYMINGTYAQALKRVASYFVTDIEIKPASRSGAKSIADEEKQKYLDFLRKTLKIKMYLTKIAVDYLTYGVSFTSVMVPFRRYLACPNCQRFEAPLSRIGNTPSFGFKWTNFEFHAKCPVCGYNGKWTPIDRRGDAESDVRIKRWNPHEMEVLYDPLRDECAFIWKIPEYYRRFIREGKLYHLERANLEVIDAVKHGNHLELSPGVIYYMRDLPLSGIDAGGWGMASAVQNFRQAWYHQLLMKYQEAIASDFIVPFRVISPEPKAGADPASADPVLGMNLGGFRQHMLRMIRDHRLDPTRIQISPVALHYQMLGGEANELAPYQLLDQAVDMLLNSCGVPAELYKGTLSLQAAPAALRLFEAHWAHLVVALNGFLEDLVDKITKLLNWEPVDATLKRVTHADDLNRQMALLQLMMGRQVSQTTGLGSLGVDFKQEQDQLLAEQEYVADKTQQVQEDMQAKQEQQGIMYQDPGAGQPALAGQPQQGAQPQQGGAAPSPQAPPSPPGVMDKAQQIASQLMSEPETQRKSDLIDLKGQDPVLHGVVTQQMQQMRRQAQTAGGAQMIAQQFPQQQPQKQAAWAGLSTAQIAAMLRKVA